MCDQDQSEALGRASEPARRGPRSADTRPRSDHRFGRPVGPEQVEPACPPSPHPSSGHDERTRAEEALRRREHEMSVLADNVPALFSHVDADGRYRFVNKRYEEWFGIPRTEVIGKHYRQVLGEAAYERISGHVQQALLGEHVRFEDALPYRSGGTRWVSADYVPDTDGEGEVKGFFALVTDITGQKRTEEALRESEERFRRLTEASFEAIAVHDKGKILDANQTCATMFGHELSEVVGMHVLDFAAPESRDLILRSMLSRSEEPFEAVGLRKDGSTFTCEVRGKAIPYQGRRVSVAAIRDITERKRAEEALQKTREELDSRVERRMRRGSAFGLTFRELTVLHLVVAGKSDKEIGAVLGISTLTASKHLANILHKMGAAGRTEAGVRAVREGLLD